MRHNGIAVAVHETHFEAESAVKALRRAGFDMKRISVVGRDDFSDEHVKFFGRRGALRGGLARALIGSALVLVPAVGNVVVLGPLAGTLAGGGASALMAALNGIGIPRRSVLRLAMALKAGKFLLVLHGDGADIVRAREALGAGGPALMDLTPKDSPRRCEGDRSCS